MTFKLEKRLIYQGKISLFRMLLSDTEKTLRTDSSKHNPLFSSNLRPKLALLVEKKISIPTAGIKPVSREDR